MNSLIPEVPEVFPGTGGRLRGLVRQLEQERVDLIARVNAHGKVLRLMILEMIDRLPPGDPMLVGWQAILEDQIELASECLQFERLTNTVCTALYIEKEQLDPDWNPGGDDPETPFE